MSATEILEQIRRLPPAEQQAIAERIREEFGDWDADLTPEQAAELDRRAEAALKNPGRGTAVEEAHAEIRKRLLTRK